MNGPTTPLHVSPRVTSSPGQQAVPRQIPFKWIFVAAMVLIGFAVGSFLLSPSPAVQSQAQKSTSWNPPSGLPDRQRYGYNGGDTTRYPVSHPIATSQPSAPYDSRTAADQRLAATKPATNEAAIMESHPTPAWAAAVAATPEAVRIAVVYDAHHDDRPTLIADAADRYAVPAISGSQPSATKSAAVRIARMDGSAEMVMPDVESTPGAVTIPAGSRIAAMLDGSVDSDLQGPVRAHVTSDVCDPRTGAVAIPRGSWLLGQQGGGIMNGTRHLGIAWTRLTYPDLSSRLLIGTDTLDREGHSGIAGRPNLSGFQVFRDTLTSSLAGAAGQIASQAASARLGNGATVVVDAPSAVNVTGSSAATRQQSWTIERNTTFLLYLERDFDRAAAYRGEQCGR
jgi:type IV secretory pathway VirB10-like protein